MDNQKDQSGTTPDQTNASRTSTSNNPAAAPTASGASTSSRKSTSTTSASESTAMPTSQSTASMPDAQSQTTANAGTERQGEGQHTNAEGSTMLDTAISSGKKWIEDSGMLNNVNQLPQSLKDLGNRAVAKVSDLTTTQKVVGGALLAVGLGWLATRKGKSSSSDNSSYNYGRQRDAGSYGRRTAGYQAPDASTSRGATARTSDSGSPYGGGSRYGSTEKNESTSGSGFGASAKTDHGSQAGKHESSGSIE